MGVYTMKKITVFLSSLLFIFAFGIVENRNTIDEGLEIKSSYNAGYASTLFFSGFVMVQ